MAQNITVNTFSITDAGVLVVQLSDASRIDVTAAVGGAGVIVSACHDDGTNTAALGTITADSAKSFSFMSPAYELSVSGGSGTATGSYAISSADL